VKIDPHSHEPIYLQIVEQVRAAIAAGVFRPDEALPAQRTLALTLGVNPNTVQKAFDELERRALVCSRRGVGMFVADRGAASAQSSTETTVEETFRRGVVAAREANMGRDRTEAIFKKAFRQEFSKIKEPR
jgi:GntR family transcriptional regulator